MSDYEDIWGPESLSTFKPVRSSPFSSPEEGIAPRRAPVPDILERVSNNNPVSAVARNRLGLSVNTSTQHSSVSENKTPAESPSTVSLLNLFNYACNK